VRSYIFQGLKRDVAFQITGITKHQYYYQKKRSKQGRGCSLTTFYTGVYWQKQEVSNDVIIQEIKHTHQDSDTDYGYQKMAACLQLRVTSLITKKYID
jgi:hypothetical protein